jgi:hypothetical protein
MSPVRRRERSSAATLAWSEPLTALPRSARSRVSSSRSLCKAAYEHPLRLPLRYRLCRRILVAPPRSGPSVARHRRVFTGESCGRREIRGCRAKPTAAHLKISSGRRGVSSEGHPQQEPAVWARQRAPTAGVRGHCPAEDIPRRPGAMDLRGGLRRLDPRVQCDRLNPTCRTEPRLSARRGFFRFNVSAERMNVRNTRWTDRDLL